MLPPPTAGSLLRRSGLPEGRALTHARTCSTQGSTLHATELDSYPTRLNSDGTVPLLAITSPVLRRRFAQAIPTGRTNSYWPRIPSIRQRRRRFDIPLRSSSRADGSLAIHASRSARSRMIRSVCFSLTCVSCSVMASGYVATRRFGLEPQAGFEPATHRLQGGSSTAELLGQKRRSTDPKGASSFLRP